MGSVIPIVLAGLAVLLAWVAPGVLARQRRLRRAPRAALVVWQAVTVGGILAALAAAPAAVPLLLGGADAAAHLEPVAAAAVLSGAVLARLLWKGHDVGTRLRRVRARHRELVDVVGSPSADGADERVRVLQHPTPTAYCIPGRQARVVLSQGVLDALPADQLAAVVAHEHAHLRGRHDLLLEFFSVVHEAVPGPLRNESALTEVRLLIEALADRAAARRSGEVATARALLALAEGRTPDAALGAGTTAPIRLRLLADGPPPPALSAVAYAMATLAAALPVILLAVAWS
ncbi:M56 family metallopeptidase [Oryzobacter telluris]|uniref:M56 family metallopeptidase n=1 Tax=Oryzobacter telluris TaxID=3149179 RepID=UPI00370D2472